MYNVVQEILNDTIDKKGGTITYTKKPLALFLSVVILLGVLTYVTLQKIEALQEKAKKESKGFYIPSSKFLKPALLSFDNLVAELYWLRAVYYIGDSVWSEKKYPQLFQLLDLVTDLDPKFAYAYEVGGTILSVYANRIDESIFLLEKGYEQNLGSWQIPFYLGYNYFFYRKDYVTAAHYISKAAELSKRLSLSKLAARLYAEGGNPETALNFLYKMYGNIEDKKVRNELKVRINEVIVERDIQYLERAKEVYKTRYGKVPGNLNLLLSTGVIKGLPREPFGGYYYIDPDTKGVRSSIKKERLKIHR